MSAATPQRALGLVSLLLAAAAAVVSRGCDRRMSRLTISDYKRGIRSRYGVDARIVGGETAVMRAEGEASQDLLVLIFELLDHPTARRCYAWELDGEAVFVLHSGSVDSPQSAVKSAAAPSLRVVEGGAVLSVTWSFRTSAGVLRIRPSSRKGRFDLWLDDLLVRSYATPEIAADDVWLATTGGPDGLDETLETEAPSELSEWTRHER